MKKKKYLPLYYKWMREGRMPRWGLCYSIDPLCGDCADLDLFRPRTRKEFKPFGYWASIYWGSGDEMNHRPWELTPMRQNIILFLAAMNDEL